MELATLKKNNPKGYIGKEEDWLLTNDFVRKETAGPTYITDGKEKDENGCHYLGKMDIPCGYCNALGFVAEIQGKINTNKVMN